MPRQTTGGVRKMKHEEIRNISALILAARGRELYEICKFIRERGWDEYYPWRFAHKNHTGSFSAYEAYEIEKRKRDDDRP